VRYSFDAQMEEYAICYCRLINKMLIDFEDISYLTKSKTVTRFPTGEYRRVPSGLKSRFPWL